MHCYSYISGSNFRRKFLGKVISKVENLYNLLHVRNRSFVRRGFRRKVTFFFQAQGCPRLFRALPSPDCVIHKYFQSFVKSCPHSICVLNCRGIMFLTNPTVCLKSVFRPMTIFFSVEFLPSALQIHSGCGQNFAI